MVVATELAPSVGIAPACLALGVSRAGFYRRQKPTLLPGPTKDRCPSPRSLNHTERRNVLDLLNSPQFVDRAPAQIHAALLDQGVYHCSTRTMYRILHDNLEVRERRDQLQHPQYHKPELIASGPCQVWSRLRSLRKRRQHRCQPTSNTRGGVRRPSRTICQRFANTTNRATGRLYQPATNLTHADNDNNPKR